MIIAQKMISLVCQKAKYKYKLFKLEILKIQSSKKKDNVIIAEVRIQFYILSFKIFYINKSH